MVTDEYGKRSCLLSRTACQKKPSDKTYQILFKFIAYKMNT